MAGESTSSPTVAARALQSKVAVVTGGGSGIGRAIAKLFAAEGARVAVLDLDPAGIGAEIEAAGGCGTAHRCDVSRRADVDGAFAEVLHVHGRLDILVNNVGIAQIGDLLATTEQDLERVFAVNVKGAYLCLRAAVAGMDAGGAIVNIASIAALMGLQDRFAYSASKGALLAMTYSVARDYLGRGIRCNAICPARVYTPFVDGFLARNYPGQEAEMFRRLSQAQPIGRMGRPEEIAALALFLASDAASFITGAAYLADGGTVNLR